MIGKWFGPVMCLFALAMVGCTAGGQSKSPPVGERGVISGTATYRERMALPPTAVLIVQLQDVSRADAPADVVAEQTVELHGKQVPIPFELAYDRSRVVDARKYSLRATIAADGAMLFTSAQAYPVLTAGAPSNVEILLQRVGAQQANPEAQADSPLLDTNWQLVELNGAPALPTMGEGREAHLVLQAKDGHFAGSGGVNRLLGSYKLDGKILTIMPGPSTLMAGPEELMKQESNFAAALMTVTGYRIKGDSLTLLKGETPVATFRAAAPGK